MEPSSERETALSLDPADRDRVQKTAGPVHAAPHRQLRYVLAVGAGGAVGVTARYLLTVIIAPVTGQPVVTLAINLVGSFLLGLLLETLSRCGPDAGRRRLIRLIVGTGGIGGFTTYSTLAVDVQSYLQAGQLLIMVGYGLGSVLLGVLAAMVGIAVGGVLTGRRSSRGRAGRA